MTEPMGALELDLSDVSSGAPSIVILEGILYEGTFPYMKDISLVSPLSSPGDSPTFPSN